MAMRMISAVKQQLQASSANSEYWETNSAKMQKRVIWNRYKQAQIWSTFIFAMHVMSTRVVSVTTELH